MLKAHHPESTILQQADRVTESREIVITILLRRDFLISATYAYMRNVHKQMSDGAMLIKGSVPQIQLHALINIHD